MKVYQVYCDGEQIGGIFASDNAARQFIAEDLMSHTQGAINLGLKPYLDISSYEVFEIQVIGFKGCKDCSYYDNTVTRIDEAIKVALDKLGVDLKAGIPIKEE